jgi:saccharopine dehydrogenase (NAD+, L-lysine-forming)
MEVSMAGDRLVVLGATGATGRRVLRLAAAAGLRPVAVGRRPDALAAVAAGLDVETRVAALNPDALDAVLTDAGVVVGAVGPATQFGSVMLAACVRTGAHWIDFSGEPRWVADVATHFGDPAAATKVCLLPALGLGVAADLAAARAAAAVGAVHRVTVAYRIAGMKPSVATARSTVEILAGGAPRASASGVRFSPAGRASAPLPGVRFPTPDAVVMHTVWPDAEIETVMAVPVVAVAGVAMGGVGAALRRPVIRRGVRRALAAWADRPQSHTRGGGGRATATALVEGSAGSCTVVGSVSDVYDVTARGGFVAARALLAGAGRPGLRSYTSVVGSDDGVAADTGVHLTCA